MPDVTLIIDGQTVTVPAGTNIVDAARSTEVSIPVFCYHPKLRPVGMCRMCLVEVWTPRIDPATRQPVLGEDGKPVLALMMGKLQPGCVPPVSDGMVVKTVTDKVQFAQKGQLEFLLSSHPLDCPVCDKGGECPLQNLTMQFGPSTSRFDYADKVHFEKPIALGDTIYLDRERCILCSRCVRFQDDIAGDPVLGFDNRGRAWEIISKSDPPFDSKFSGNTTDICPVGALTSADFRFKSRVWEVRSVPTICTHCPVGCNLTFDMRHNQLMRVMPRENDYVNEIWNCDKGRFGMRFAESGDRLTTPLIRRNGKLVEASWEEALQLVGERLAELRDDAGSQALAGLAAPDLSNEDLFLFGKLLHDTLGSPNLDHRVGVAGEAAIDDLPAAYGVGQGTNLLELGKGTAVLVFGADPEEEAPLYLLRLRGILARGGDVTVVNPYATKLEHAATRSLRVRPGAEQALALALLKVVIDEALDTTFAERLRDTDQLRRILGEYTLAQLAEAAGVAEEQIQAGARAFAQAEHGIIIYGRHALAGGNDLSNTLANLALLCGKVGRANSGLIALTSGGNTRGAIDMGVRPRGGLSAAEYWPAASAGTLRGMYIAGLDPARQSAAAAAALGNLEFLVVQDIFLTATAELAHVVLPTATLFERDGTFTNAERRVQRSRQARPASAGQPAPWEIFQRVAQAIPVAVPAGNSNGSDRAAGWGYVVASDVADEISRKVAGYSSAGYTSLGVTRQSWGRQANDDVYYDGTSYINTEGVGVQISSRADDPKASFSLSRVAYPGAAAGEGIALLPVVRAYDGGDWARGSKLQPRMVPAHVVLSHADAARIGIGVGETVRIETVAGSASLPAQIDTGLAEGVALLPLVAGIAAGDLLTGAVTAARIERAE
ncbi:MAG TPA: NADH-quinone oxidoreductase subunit NuoG [Roseiflexaceae bacterium]|nr:NADH-quinone oxidoreductase subunit NuoG [Roseiflexaceae bacterium]